MHNIKIGIQFMYIRGYFSIQNGYVVVSKVFTFISENPRLFWYELDTSKLHMKQVH